MSLLFLILGPFAAPIVLVVFGLLIYGLHEEGFPWLAAVLLSLWIDLGLVVFAGVAVYKHLKAHDTEQAKLQGIGG